MLFLTLIHFHWVIFRFFFQVQKTKFKGGIEIGKIRWEKIRKVACPRKEIFPFTFSLRPGLQKLDVIAASRWQVGCVSISYKPSWVCAWDLSIFKILTVTTFRRGQFSCRCNLDCSVVSWSCVARFNPLLHLLLSNKFLVGYFNSASAGQVIKTSPSR